MSTWLNAYGNGVINVMCPHCGVGPLERCHGGMSDLARTIPPHKARVNLAKKVRESGQLVEEGSGW